MSTNGLCGYHPLYDTKAEPKVLCVHCWIRYAKAHMDRPLSMRHMLVLLELIQEQVDTLSPRIRADGEVFVDLPSVTPPQ